MRSVALLCVMLVVMGVCVNAAYTTSFAKVDINSTSGYYALGGAMVITVGFAGQSDHPFTYIANFPQVAFDPSQTAVATYSGDDDGLCTSKTLDQSGGLNTLSVTCNPGTLNSFTTSIEAHASSTVPTGQTYSINSTSSTQDTPTSTSTIQFIVGPPPTTTPTPTTTTTQNPDTTTTTTEGPVTTSTTPNPDTTTTTITPVVTTTTTTAPVTTSTTTTTTTTPISTGTVTTTTTTTQSPATSTHAPISTTATTTASSSATAIQIPFAVAVVISAIVALLF